MNRTEIKQMAWVGDNLVKGPIRGVIVTLHGLGTTEMKSDGSPEEKQWGEAGFLTVYPYYGPWSWMNRESRDMVDELVASIYREYAIPASAPLVLVGGSMGGLSALIFTRYSRRPVARCCAIYPVCDLSNLFTVRADVPRTIRMAFWGYKEPFAEVMIEHSPLHQVGRMPKVPYFFLHGDADKSVNKEMNSDRMVAEMKKHRHAVEYHEIPGYGHGGPLPTVVEQAKLKFVLGA